MRVQRICWEINTLILRGRNSISKKASVINTTDKKCIDARGN